MITVIEHGIAHYRGRCREACNCIFEFDEADVRYDKDYVGYWIECPECGARYGHRNFDLLLERLRTR